MRQRGKRARIEAARRFVNGERTAEGPTRADDQYEDQLYPCNWTRVPKMDADFDPYSDWRWQTGREQGNSQ